ncbi:hypothetical protein shim_38710 [Shimia sp. SK013]|nr:hypothetical protein shim_38710 [Shimia sp. SK013]
MVAEWGPAPKPPGYLKQEEGLRMAAPPMKDKMPSPCAVIGFPACSASQGWPKMVNKTLLPLAQNILAEGIESFGVPL